MAKKKAELSDQPKPLVTNVHGGCRMLDCSRDYFYGLLNTGEIESYLDGRARKIVIASIEAHIRRRLESSKQFERAHYPKRPDEHQRELETT